MAANTKTAFEELAELDARIRAAEARRDGIRREQGHARAAVRRAEADLLDVEERVGAGEADEAEVAAAEEALAAAAEAADITTVKGRVRGGTDAGGTARVEGMAPSTEASLGRWEARIRGAERVVAEAEDARRDFIRQRFADLAGELAETDAVVTEELNAAWGSLRAAAGGYARQQRAWRTIAALGGIHPDALPSAAPLAGIPGEVTEVLDAGLEVPTPRALRQ